MKCNLLRPNPLFKIYLAPINIILANRMKIQFISSNEKNYFLIFIFLFSNIFLTLNNSSLNK